MKQNLLTKVLLLCALIVGSSSVAWGQEPVEILSWSRPQTTDVTTQGYSLSTNTSAKTGYRQDNSSAGTTYYLSVSGDDPLLSTVPASVSLKIKLGGGTANKDLTSPVFVCYVDENGEAIDQTEVQITSHISSKENDPYEISLPTDIITSAYGINVYHVKTEGYNVRFYSLSLEYVPQSSSYSIEAIPNDENMGSVSLSGTTIIATPNSGYRVKSGDAGYTVTDGDATVTNNGNNTFSVTATSDCTIQINFEVIPSHALAFIVSPEGAGTVALGANTVQEGFTTTATATANAGYEFTGWSISGTGASLSSATDNPTTVTMGTADATVTATFTAVVTHEINWSVNGTIVKTENIKEGNTITFADPESGVPTGYNFIGWTTSAITSPQSDDSGITFVSSGNSEEDITYYAVLAVQTSEGTSTTIELTNAMIKETSDADPSGRTAYKDRTFGDWTGFCQAILNGGNYWIGLNRVSSGSAYNSHITTPVCPYPIKSISIETTNGTGQNERTIYLCSSNEVGAASATDATYGFGVLTEKNGTLDIDVEGNPTQFHIYPSGTFYIKSISLVYGELATYSDYCTTIPPVTANITSAGYATFSSFTNVDFSANEDLTVFTAKQNGTSITLTEVDSKKVPANTAVILKGEGGDFNGTVVATADALENNDLQIAEEDMNGSSGKIYVLNKVNGVVGFYKLAANGTLTKGKAYLEAESEAPYFGFDGEGTTGILNIERTVIDNQYYTLDGRRVAEPKKGLYIINGKKVVIK